jgi:hypothetical protein
LQPLAIADLSSSDADYEFARCAGDVGGDNLVVSHLATAFHDHLQYLVLMTSIFLYFLDYSAGDVEGDNLLVSHLATAFHDHLQSLVLMTLTLILS